MDLGRKLVPLLILGMLQVGDLISTRLVLRIPGALEVNPLVRDLGLWHAKILALVIVLLVVWRAKTLRRLWVVCGIYGAVVLSNIFMLLRYTGVLA